MLVGHSSCAEVERLESSVELLGFGELELPEEEESESSRSDEASDHDSSSSSRAEEEKKRVSSKERAKARREGKKGRKLTRVQSSSTKRWQQK